jgi:hypothetical protein
MRRAFGPGAIGILALPRAQLLDGVGRLDVYAEANIQLGQPASAPHVVAQLKDCMSAPSGSASFPVALFGPEPAPRSF